MNLTDTDHTDMGILLAWAMRPAQRPGRNPEYSRVLRRYRGELEFRTALDAVLLGLGARVLSDGDFGLILGVETESPLAFHISDFPYAGKAENRLLAGLVLTGLAAYAYPSADELEDDRVRHVSAREFEPWLRGLCEQLRTHDAAGEIIPEEGLDGAWRTYLDMPPIVVGKQGRASGKFTSACTRYWIDTILTWLGGQGMARPDTTADGAWTLTERFRIHAKEIAMERAYTYIADIRRRSNA